MASTGCHHAHLLCGLACRYHGMHYLHIMHVMGNCSLASTSGQGMIIWQPHPPCLYFLKALSKPSWSLGDVPLSAISNHLVSQNSHTATMTQAGDRRFAHTRDRRMPSQHLATIQTSRCTSLLSARCPVQHVYIIACCHVITLDNLVGTVPKQPIDSRKQPIVCFGNITEKLFCVWLSFKCFNCIRSSH